MPRPRLCLWRANVYVPRAPRDQEDEQPSEGGGRHGRQLCGRKHFARPPPACENVLWKKSRARRELSAPFSRVGRRPRAPASPRPCVSRRGGARAAEQVLVRRPWQMGCVSSVPVGPAQKGANGEDLTQYHQALERAAVANKAAEMGALKPAIKGGRRSISRMNTLRVISMNIDVTGNKMPPLVFCHIEVRQPNRAGGGAGGG